MDDFYLTLISDSSLEMFPKNKQSSFTTKLDRPIQLEKELWKVCLVESVLPSDIYNITSESNHLYAHFYDTDVYEKLGRDKMNSVCMQDGTCPEMKISIPEGSYFSAEDLVEELQAEIEEKLGRILRPIHSMITLSYKKSGNRVSLHVQNPKQVQLRFPKPLGEILGLDSNLFDRLIDDSKQAFKYPVDLNIARHQVFVYSDVASYTNIGSITAPILRVISFKHSPSITHPQQEFVNLHYVPVAKSYIDQIHIEIKDEIGRCVPFVGGKTLVKLHFRQNSK